MKDVTQSHNRVIFEHRNLAFGKFVELYAAAFALAPEKITVTNATVIFVLVIFEVGTSIKAADSTFVVISARNFAAVRRPVVIGTSFWYKVKSVYFWTTYGRYFPDEKNKWQDYDAQRIHRSGANGFSNFNDAS